MPVAVETPREGSWCLHVRAWTHVKHRYAPTVTSPERLALVSILDTCTAS